MPLQFLWRAVYCLVLPQDDPWADLVDEEKERLRAPAASFLAMVNPYTALQWAWQRIVYALLR